MTTKNKRKEARLLGYQVFYDYEGKLITERVTTDITSLKKYFSKEEYNILQTVMREATHKLNQIHNYIETSLNARKLKD